MLEAKDRVNNNINNNKEWTRMRIAFVVLAAIALVFAFSCIYKSSSTINRETRDIYNPGTAFESNNYESMSEGWTVTYEDGTSEVIDLPRTIEVEPGESFMITHAWDNKYLMDPAIIMSYKRYGVQVYADDMLVWQVNTSSLARKILFTDPAFIEVAEGAFAPEEIRIRFSNSVNGVYPINEILRGTMAAAEHDMLKNELSTLTILLIMAIMSLTIIVADVIYVTKRYKEPRLLCLAAFLILAFLWGATDSYMIVLSPIPAEIIGFVLYISLMAMPIPMAEYIWLTCKKRGFVLPSVALFGVVNIIVQMILVQLEVIKLSDTILLSHAYSLVVIGVSLVELILEIKKEPENDSLKISLAGGGALSCLCALALYLYWRGNAMHYRNSMLIGIIIFFICLMIGTAMDYTKRARNEQKKLQEAEINERLSFYDDLTSLKNRRAFEKTIAEIESEEEFEDVLLVMFDVNGLKYTNDNYGHAAGDDLIIAAGDVISDTFEGIGECFRIGGDEFAAIVENPELSNSEYSEILDGFISQWNYVSNWKLSIARGYSNLVKSDGERISISDWKLGADVEMYRNKLATSSDIKRDQTQELKQIIDTIVTTVEAKDIYTAVHSERVRELSNFIGEKLGLTASTLSKLDMAAYLHDIGKIGVPDVVLNKPGSLSEEEFKLMAEHTEIGAEIIGKASGFRDVATIIRFHHERYDGNGYPRGLVGAEIPLESRIIAIADSIDAMTSKRVYRENLSIDECRLEIENNAGRMYDPAIVKIALEHWEGIKDIILLHPKHLVRETVQK